MPSGAKKRKAVKKKKEKEANSNSLHGEDDPKVHEEKESDGGETGSPLSQDNHNNVHFVEGEEKREEDTSSIQSAVAESESVGVIGNGEISKKVSVEEKSSIQIDRKIKLEDDSEPKAVTIEHVEIEDVYSSRSSSSDDESKFVDKNIEVINWEEPIEYAPNLAAEAAAVVYSEQTSDLPEVTQVNEIVSHDLALVTPNEESYKDVSAEGPSSISDKPADLPEITVVPKAVSIVPDHDFIAESKVEVPDLVSEAITQNEDLGSKVNGKTEISEVPSNVIDTGSQSNVDILSTKATEDFEGTKIATVEEDKSKTLPQSSFPAVNGAQHKKESKIGSMDRQTPVALPPRPVQATSSMGCCGLFELIMGSNR